MECPIKLNNIHCQNCYFIRNDKCCYREIMREKETLTNALKEIIGMHK